MRYTPDLSLSARLFLLAQLTQGVKHIPTFYSPFLPQSYQFRADREIG
jgi:hypothetical protein